MLEITQTVLDGGEVPHWSRTNASTTKSITKTIKTQSLYPFFLPHFICHLLNSSPKLVDSTTNQPSIVEIISQRRCLALDNLVHLAHTSVPNFHMISVDTWSNPEQHVGVIFGLDLRELLVVLAPERSLPVLFKWVGFVCVSAHVWCDGTESVNAHFAWRLIADGVNVGFTPSWEDGGYSLSVCGKVTH